MNMPRVGKLEILTKFDKTADGKLIYDGKIFTSVTVTEIDRGYRITVTDAEHPEGASYDFADNGLIIVGSIEDIEALADVDECLILVPHEIADNGRTFYAGLLRKSGESITQVSRFATTDDVANWNDANAKKHWHQNAEQLEKIGEDQSGNATYDGETLAKKSDLDDALSDIEDEIAALSSPDTLMPLELGTTYNELIVRSDWQDVPVYLIDDNPFVCRLASDDTVGDFARSEIRLQYLVDYITGLPVPALSVTSGGAYRTCFPVTYHAMGHTMAAGWYDENDDPITGTPTFTDMTFDKLEFGMSDPYRSLDDLPTEALCALETLSRMVNVSVDAMGSLGIVPDGVQRLNHAPVSGRRYACVTNRDMTLPLPAISWTGKERDFWVDLDCTSSINLTFSDDVSYEDGNNVDTTRGKHRLHFYAPAGASMWTVAETESYTEITEDYLPEYVIPFRYCTADQIRAVLKLGYSDGNGNWCVRRKGGIVQTWFSIGDTRPVTLTDGQEVNMRIIGIEHDDLPNGGKAALTCDFVELISVATFDIRSALYDQYVLSIEPAANAVYNTFPEYLRELVSDAQKYAYGFFRTTKTWVFAPKEVFPNNSDNQYDSQYSVFTDDSSRIRYNASGNPTNWIMRSGFNGASNFHACVSMYGKYASMSASSNVNNLAIGFCLNA